MSRAGVAHDASAEVVVARRLAEAGADYLSGEELGRELGKSRAAIGEHVQSLRAGGFDIEASTRRGYRLVSWPDRVTAPAILPRLRTRHIGRTWLYKESCASTNDLAGEAAREGAPHGLVVIAEQQTAGRGRLGRSWFSPADGNLYLSIVLRPPWPPADVPPLTLLCGAALAEAVATFGVQARLKWPNDLLLVEAVDSAGGASSGAGEAAAGATRKAAGILTEMVADMDRVRHVVVGVGVDVNGVDWPPDVAPRATSLRRVLGRPVSRAALLIRFLETLEAAYQQAADGDGGARLGVAAFRRHMERDRRYVVRQGNQVVEGVAAAVDDDGALLLKLDSGEIRRIISGELESP